MKHELRNIISGKSAVEQGSAIQTIASYLRKSKETSAMVKGSINFKKQEADLILKFANKNNFWVKNINFNSFISSGAEQRVYLSYNNKVLKLNDAIYYESCVEYFNNLLINNYFFSDTAYNLIGFHKNEDVLYAVVEQNYVYATEKTNLENVKTFLSFSGFKNKKNNDYFNNDLGIILEDLHDENVLTQDGVLKFIDKVFYITEKFYKNE